MTRKLISEIALRGSRRPSRCLTPASPDARGVPWKSATLGRSGLRVSAIGLGCNNFGGRIDLEATRAVIHKALDLGITLFDTADVYGERGGSETAMGQVLGDAPQADRAGHQVRHADGRRRASGRAARGAGS